MKQDKDMTTKTEVRDGMHMPHKRFTHIYLLSNTVVVAIMISVTFLIEHIHQQALATTDKKEETTKIMKVAAIGDSITDGRPYDGVTEEENSYPTQLQSLLGDKYKVYNYGVSGRTLLSSGDEPYTVEKAYRESQKINPDVVLVMLGTNDSKPLNWNAEEYRAELTALIRNYRNLVSKPEVYVMTIPPMFGENAGAPTNFNKVTAENEVVPIIRRVGKDTNTPVIDIYQAMKDSPDLFVDGTHPNVAGSKEIAKQVYEAIEKTSSVGKL
jgi:lysophospholipase L1-like esterase